MRILNIPDGESPKPAPDMGRVDALEDISKSILQKLHSIEERVEALEQSPKAAEPAPAAPLDIPQPSPHIPLAAITLDAEAFKKNLFDKMWKYLNNKAAA